MKTIKQTYKIKAPLGRVWQALTDPAVIEKWGGGPALMNETIGFKFSLWGGAVFGTNLNVQKNSLLVQDWADTDLPNPTPVEFKLTGNDATTEIVMKQTNVPDDRVQDLADGWKRYYLGPLKSLLESERINL